MTSRRKILSMLSQNPSKRKKQPVIIEHSPDEGEVGGNPLLQGESSIDRGRRPKRDSFLLDDTSSMDRERRNMEQDGHRKRARVHAREHHEREEAKQQSLEKDNQCSILQHPALNNQRFDGIDPNVNPEPPLNTDARREFDNERREQDKEKQLRLGNMPKFSTAPKPQGPY